MGRLISLSERRTWLGHRVGVAAQIEREPQSSLRCTVLDVSRHGACVSAPATALPKIFVLRVADGTRHVCDVQWRHGYVVGVRFVHIDQLVARTAKASAKLNRSCARALGYSRKAADEIG
jgi:hypothetical protein